MLVFTHTHTLVENNYCDVGKMAVLRGMSACL